MDGVCHLLVFAKVGVGLDLYCLDPYSLQIDVGDCNAIMKISLLLLVKASDFWWQFSENTVGETKQKKLFEGG
jgi:hypothetical protein